MVDSRVEKLAKLCVYYSVDVKPKEQVVIRELSELSFPLINEIYKECLLRDAYPLLMFHSNVGHACMTHLHSTG